MAATPNRRVLSLSRSLSGLFPGDMRLRDE